jgi:hypothetical protein
LILRRGNLKARRRKERRRGFLERGWRVSRKVKMSRRKNLRRKMRMARMWLGED